MKAVLLAAEFRRTLRLAQAYWLKYVSDFVLYFVGILLLMVIFNAPNRIMVRRASSSAW